VTDDHLAITPEEVRELHLPENWVPVARGGARNSVFYQTEDLAADDSLPMASGNLYAGGQLPVWSPAPGDVLRLTVPVPEAGEYRIHFIARLDPGSGALHVNWDGAPAGGSNPRIGIDFVWVQKLE